MTTEHTLTFDDGRWQCAVCRRRWPTKPFSRCPGVPVYAWGHWPAHLLTKKQLSDAGLQTGKQLPAPAGAVYRKKSPGGIMWLYDRHQGVPKRPITPAQRTALAKARHQAETIEQRCVICGDVMRIGTRKRLEALPPAACFLCQAKGDASAWARERLAARDFVILDTETTALDGEIVEIAVIDPDGAPLLNTLVLPRRPWVMMKSGSFRIHGISVHELARNAPGWGPVWRWLEPLISGRRVLTYNAEFDQRMVTGMNAARGFPRVTGWECLMEWYAQFVGAWSERHRSFRWQPLNGGHRALGDCRAALDVLKTMAAWEEYQRLEDATHTHQALVARYGTRSPETIRDYWERTT